MNLSDVSIVLLTKNGGDLFGRVIDGLMRCDGARDAEILIIDSGSTDGTLDHARRHPEIRIHQIPPSEFGHGKTRNLGATLTSRPILVFGVQDATPTGPEFLRELVAPLDDPEVAGAFGRQIAYDWTNRIEKMFMAEQYPPGQVVKQRKGDGPLGIRDMFFSNVCSAIRRSVFERIPFDETLIMSEDQLWAKSALLAGHKVVYQGSATVLHSHNYRLKEVFKRNFDSGVSLLGVAEDSFLSMVGYEISHVWNGVRDLAGTRDFAWIPYFFVYEGTRAVAFTTGQRAHLLPDRLKRALSLHSYHWKPAGR